MRGYYLKTYIEKLAKEYCNVLELPLLPIYYATDETIAFESKAFNDKLISGRLIIDINKLCKMIKNKSEYVFAYHNLKNAKDKIRFTIGHEIGHYLSVKKHPKFSIKHLNFEKDLFNKKPITHILYRQLPLEKIADKIGLYLIKNQVIK